MATSAKNIGVKVNCSAITGDGTGTAITSYCNKVALERTMNLIDSTVFGTSGMARSAALVDASLDISGFYDPALVAAIETQAMAGTACIVHVHMDTSGGTTVDGTHPMYGFTGRWDGFKGPEADPKGLLTFSAKLMLSDGIVPARATTGTF